MATQTPKHTWTFFRAGGVDQVLLETGADLTSLDQLDQKLWLALAMPTRGLEFDSHTLDLLDTDKDGRIRPPEVIAALHWVASSLKDLGDLKRGGDVVSLSAIKDPELLAGAKRLLATMGKPDADKITLADVADTSKLLAGTAFNGDGVITPDSAGEHALAKALIDDIIATVGSTMDRGGKPGINQAQFDAFFAQLQLYADWRARAETDPALVPGGIDAAKAASDAVAAVKVKVDDYYTRCKLVAFDPRAGASMNRDEKDLATLSTRDLSLSSVEIAALPLAHVDASKPLPLGEGVNPAWVGLVTALKEKAVTPLLGEKAQLTEADWTALQGKLAGYLGWMAAKPVVTVEKLGLDRVKALLQSEQKAQVASLIAQDAALEKEFSQIAGVEKLVRYQRDLFDLLKNFVNFADFYGRAGSVFQAGTLFLDARACDLCIEVLDPGKHATLAVLSSAYLAYCELARPGEAKRTVVAVFTNGDSDNLMVGRNGVFYDRKGRDWDATITKIVSNPISIREAFFAPYKKLVRLIEEQVTKRAADADTHSTSLVTTAATTVANVDKAAPAATPAAAPAAAAPAAVTAAAPPKKLDLGTIALIGTAIGGVSALVGGFLTMLFGLGMWMPLGIFGVVMVISGPSMLLAYLKLRQRNLGPILDANGWAINTKAKMNVPFGASLTHVAKLPQGSSHMLRDPFADQDVPWKRYLLLVLVILLGCIWFTGKMDDVLPDQLMKKTLWPPKVPAMPVPPTAPPATPAPTPAVPAAK